MKEELNKSLFEVFSAHAESFSDAKKKSNDESSQRLKYLRLKNSGAIRVRILPLAPVIGPDNEITMPRKGYEYPCKEQMLKIKKNTVSKDGKVGTIYVNVCHIKYVFPQAQADLIDTYVKIAREKYEADTALIKKLGGNSFEGGLKWDSKRYMYVLDLENRKDGPQVLRLSYAQYKDIEDRKLAVWEKLCVKNKNAQCPISSFSSAYPVEIIGKTEAKTSYSFNIDTIDGVDELSNEELQALLDFPRLPEVAYRYTRYHLEATQVFLKQLDERFNIDVMSSAEIKDVIDQISMMLPADDTSHFTMESNNTEDTSANSNEESIDDLWNLFDELEAAQLDDRSEEGLALRSKIKEYISTHDLDIRVTRSMSNYDMLKAIDDLLDNAEEKKEEDAPAKPAPASVPVEESDDDDDEEPAAPAPKEEEAPAPRRTERVRTRRSM